MATEVFDPTRVTTKAEFSSFTELSDAGVRSYIYVEADGAISVGAVCVIDSDGSADELDSANTNIYGLPLGVAQTAIANDSHGWLQVSGPCAAIQVSAAVAVGAQVFGTTTDGAISTTNVANANITGIKVNVRSSAGNTSGFLWYPTYRANE